MYAEADSPMNGTLKYGSFMLNGENFAAIDGFGQHEFDFNERVSIVIECKDQKEIDEYWNALSEDGKESRCGCQKDKFRVSCQIIHKNLSLLMSDKTRSQKLIKTYVGMKKIEVQTLENV